MDEEITIIDTNTRNQKIKNFLVNNKKKFIITFIIIIITSLSFVSYESIKKKNKTSLINKYNIAIENYNLDNKIKTINELKSIIAKKDKTYSPLALYFVIDNNLIQNEKEINKLFDILIEETNLEKEIKNLIIYKKGLFNAEILSENELIQLLSPIMTSQSVWESHALYLLGEYFMAQNQKQKAKEFYEKILLLNNGNQNISLEARKILKRDFSE